MKLYAYSRTMAGAQRLARARQAPALTVEAPKPEPTPVVEPVASNVVRLVTIHHIIDLMARMHGCTYEEMKGPSRSKRIVAGRDAAICALMVFNPKLSRGQIGVPFNRDPSTVFHAQRKRGL